MKIIRTDYSRHLIVDGIADSDVPTLDINIRYNDDQKGMPTTVMKAVVLDAIVIPEIVKRVNAHVDMMASVARLRDENDQLLAALKGARDHLIMDIDRDGRGVHSHDTPEALAQARAAIAKAEGRAK